MLAIRLCLRDGADWVSARGTSSARVLCGLLLIGMAACRNGHASTAAAAEAPDSLMPRTTARAAADAHVEPAPRQCVVFLHGKSGKGEPILQGPVYSLVRPNGNAEGWGGRQWIYFPEPRYAEVRQIVERAIQDSGCER